MTGGWRIAIDFGTSNTAAALIRDDDGRVRVVRLERDSDAMPSAVIVGDESQPSLAGRPAFHAMQVAPTRFIAHPKLVLGGSTVLIGGRMYRATSLVALTLAVVRQKAMRMMDETHPSEVVLTHPVSWDPQRIDGLIQSAVKAGFDIRTIRTVSEPVAAAHLYGRDEPPAPGERIAVFDFGGGTLDIAIIERDIDQTVGYRVVGNDGDEHLGGKDFDDLLYRWVAERLEESHGEAARVALRDPANLRHQLTLRQSVTAAKEDLSESQTATIPVSFPGIDVVLTVTRGEYENLIRPDIDRAVQLTKLLIALTRTERLDRIYLTGGSSRTPLVHRALIDAVGTRTSTLFDPKLVVAEGALWTPREALPPAAPGQEYDPQPPAADDPPPPPPSPPQAEQAAPPVPRLPEAADPPPPTPPAGPPASPPDRRPPASGLGSGIPSQPAPQRAQRSSRRPLVLWLVLGGVSLLTLIAVIIGAVALSGNRGQETEPSVRPDTAVTPVAADSIDCWDGESYPETDGCPPLEGSAALRWAFPLDGDPTCTERTTDYIEGALEGLQCVWEDLGSSTIVNITRFGEGETADAWATFYAGNDGAQAGPWTNGDETPGTSWIVLGGADGPSEQATTLIYDDLDITLDVWTRPSENGTDETHEKGLTRVHGLTLDEIADTLASIP